MTDNHDMSILNIEVVTRTSTNQIDLAEDLRINSVDINKDFCEQPAKFAYWATVAVQAQALVDRKKMEVDKQDDYIRKTLVGELDAEVRQEMEMNGEKATETKVTNRIYIHERYKEEVAKLYDLKEELLELQQKSALLNVAKDAMVQRKDALISLGAQLRLEGNNSTDLSLKAAEVIGKNRAGRKAIVGDK